MRRRTRKQTWFIQQQRKDPAPQGITARDWHYRKTYGITLLQYNQLLAQQAHRCAICRRKVPYNLHIDHNHKTGEIRGLLCEPCNRGLGFFRDEPRYLLRAIQYLERSFRIKPLQIKEH